MFGFDGGAKGLEVALRTSIQGLFHPKALGSQELLNTSFVRASGITNFFISGEQT